MEHKFTHMETLVRTCKFQIASLPLQQKGILGPCHIKSVPNERGTNYCHRFGWVKQIPLNLHFKLIDLLWHTIKLC